MNFIGDELSLFKAFSLGRFLGSFFVWMSYRAYVARKARPLVLTQFRFPEIIPLMNNEKNGKTVL